MVPLWEPLNSSWSWMGNKQLYCSTTCFESNATRIDDNIHSLSFYFSTTGHSNIVCDALLLNDEKQIMTVSWDGSLRIFDAETGENVYGFFNHQAESYQCLASNPTEDTFLAANRNSMVYILKTSRNDS